MTSQLISVFGLNDARMAAIAAICYRLDGLPLALELAAARVRVLNPEVLLTSLERRLPLLTSQDRDVPARQRTLRNTIALSYELSALSPADDEARALALHGSALLALWQGELNIACMRAEERLALARKLEEPTAIATALTNLGTIKVNMGRDAEAYQLLREAQPLCHDAGNAYFYAITLVHLGNATLGVGAIEEAQSWLEEATALSREIGEPWLLAFALNNLGEVARVEGRYDRARANYKESETLLRASGDKGDLARSWHSLGYVALAAEKLGEAETYFKTSLELFRKLGNQRGIAECVAGIGAVRVRQEQAEKGVALLSAAERALQASGASWWPADRAELRQNYAFAQRMLDPERLAAARRQGEQTTLEQAAQLCDEQLSG